MKTRQDNTPTPSPNPLPHGERALTLSEAQNYFGRSLALKDEGERSNKQRGNAMVYVLIALAMFGFLTMTLSRSNDQADGQDIDDEQAEFYALELMEYAATARTVVDQMLFSGSTVDDLDFVIPTDAAFNTPPHHNKVYHPQGGGLNYRLDLPEALAALPGSSGWRTMTIQNTEWTPTTAPDKLLTAIYIPRQICEVINKKIMGNTDIPLLTIGGIELHLVEGGTSDEDLTTIVCPDCVGKTNICIRSTGDTYAYYSIIAAQ